ASRSSSLPAPVSRIASPAVACGTQTWRRPSAAPASERNDSAGLVRSCTTARLPVLTSISVEYMPPVCYDRASRAEVVQDGEDAAIVGFTGQQAELVEQPGHVLLHRAGGKVELSGDRGVRPAL